MQSVFMEFFDRAGRNGARDRCANASGQLASYEIPYPDTYEEEYFIGLLRSACIRDDPERNLVQGHNILIRLP